MLAQNFVECLEQAFKKHWEYPAFSDYEGRRLRYGQAAEQIAWLHAIFRKLHLKKGDKIALAGRNSVLGCHVSGGHHVWRGDCAHSA